MKQRKSIWMVLFLSCVLMLTACQPSPNDQTDAENGQASITTMPQSNNEKQTDINDDLYSTSNMDLIHSADGTKVEETLTTTDGKEVILNASVATQNVEDVHQYQYSLIAVSDELRKALFQAYFGERASEAIYDQRNDVWELHNSESIGDYYL